MLLLAGQYGKKLKDLNFKRCYKAFFLLAKIIHDSEEATLSKQKNTVQTDGGIK
jgi:hypothetical protein